jgi:hypothetical protein
MPEKEINGALYILPAEGGHLNTAIGYPTMVRVPVLVDDHNRYPRRSEMTVCDFCRKDLTEKPETYATGVGDPWSHHGSLGWCFASGYRTWGNRLDLCPSCYEELKGAVEGFVAARKVKR